MKAASCRHDTNTVVIWEGGFVGCDCSDECNPAAHGGTSYVERCNTCDATRDWQDLTGKEAVVLSDVLKRCGTSVAFPSMQEAKGNG